MAPTQAVEATWRAWRRCLSRDGLLPEAVVNYLLRLGWSHGDEEIISRDDAVRCSISAASANRRHASISQAGRHQQPLSARDDDAGLWDPVTPHIDPTSPAAAAASPRWRRRRSAPRPIWISLAASAIWSMMARRREDDAAGLLDDDEGKADPPCRSAAGRIGPPIHCPAF